MPRLPHLIVFSLLAVLSLPACVSSEPSDEPEVAIVDDDEDAGVALASCESNADCAGGEVCRNDVCGQACDDDNPCTDGVCNSDGYCVDCEDAAQCGDDERCIAQQCVFFCGNNDDCGADQVCNPDAGTCHDVECQDASDCAGGERCDGNLCVSIDEVICTAGAETCDENRRALCAEDGTAWSYTACGENETCSETDAGTQCTAVVCEANGFGCLDDQRAFVCNEDGTERTELACGEGKTCLEGVCEIQVCSPNEVQCGDENQIVVCDTQGLSSTSTRCDDVAECDDALGCTCLAANESATCEPRICVPGQSECVGNGQRTCLATGLGYADVQPCDEGESCQQGTCLSQACEAQSTLCVNGERLRCLEGTRWELDACGTDELCSEENGSAQCVSQSCTPGEMRCADDVTTALCNAQGSGETLSSCAQGQQCSSGVCEDIPCVPDCAGRQCGMDPVCGATCGTCGGGTSCSVDGQCVADAVPLPMRIEVTSLGTGDFDLYLHPQMLCGSSEAIYFGRATADWNNNSLDDDPRFNPANTDGFGEEFATWDVPRDGSFQLSVNHYANAANAQSAAFQIKIYRGSEVVSDDLVSLWVGDMVSFNLSLTGDNATLERQQVVRFVGCANQTTCANDSSCSNGGDVCLTSLGICGSLQNEGGVACLDNAPCAPGETCGESDGMCRTPGCVSHSECGEGLCRNGNCFSDIPCGLNSDCPELAFCRDYIVTGSCAVGCRTSDECVSGDVCNNAGECLNQSEVLAPGAICDATAGPRCLHGFICNILFGVCMANEV